jgi:hypothetical protein
MDSSIVGLALNGFRIPRDVNAVMHYLEWGQKQVHIGTSGKITMQDTKKNFFLL